MTAIRIRLDTEILAGIVLSRITACHHFTTPYQLHTSPTRQIGILFNCDYCSFLLLDQLLSDSCTQRVPIRCNQLDPAQTSDLPRTVETRRCIADLGLRFNNFLSAGVRSLISCLVNFLLRIMQFPCYSLCRK